MTFDVEQAALNFAQEVQDLLDHVLPVHVAPEDRVVQAETADGVRWRVETAAKNGSVVVTKGGQGIAHLRIMFLCTTDAAGAYLKVDRCDIGLYSLDGRLPLMRLDFRSDMHSVPSCHWNVHAESGATTRILTLGNPEHSGVFSKLHFPVGGARMRPCLEDFLNFLVFEFGIDTLPDALTVLAEGRERWRRRQIGTLVRDAPEEAVRVLEELGYAVAAPTTGPVLGKPEKLRAW